VLEVLRVRMARRQGHSGVAGRGQAVSQACLGGAAEKDRHRSGRPPLRHHGVVPAMGGGFTCLALFLDISHFAIRGDFAIASNDASACELGEPEKPNETHMSVRVYETSALYVARHVPRCAIELSASPHLVMTPVGGQRST
jgi:hypothetical protein